MRIASNHQRATSNEKDINDLYQKRKFVVHPILLAFTIFDTFVIHLLFYNYLT